MSVHHPLKNIAEWRKGCSCASPGNPAECQECTAGLISAIEKWFTESQTAQPALWVHPTYLIRRPGMTPLAIDATLNQIAPAQVPLYAHADSGEVQRLRDKLVKINELIFAVGAPLGGDVYFEIRKVCAEELRKASGGPQS